VQEHYTNFATYLRQAILRVNNFEIEIPNDRLKTYKIVTFIILTLNFLGFGLAFLNYSSVNTYIALFGLMINAVAWLYYLLNKRHIKTPILETSFITSAFIWIYFGNIWMGVMLFAFGIMGFFANKKSIIQFTDEGITYPSFPIKKYEWAAISQVIWKDDILTIDLKENKLIQFNIDKAIAEKFDVVGFNKFCEGNVGE
jgi:hypothetical protein